GSAAALGRGRDPPRPPRGGGPGRRPLRDDASWVHSLHLAPPADLVATSAPQMRQAGERANACERGGACPHGCLHFLAKEEKVFPSRRGGRRDSAPYRVARRVQPGWRRPSLGGGMMAKRSLPALCALLVACATAPRMDDPLPQDVEYVLGAED